MVNASPFPSTRSLSGDDADEVLVPGYRNYLVYTDESGMNGAKYYGFGSLWLPFERRGDFQGELAKIRARHRLADELKWTKVSARSEPLGKDVITWFFQRKWMMFHCIVIPRQDVDWSLHDGREDAQQKHFSMLLKNKIAYFARGGGKVYRIRVDPLPSRYPKADEVVHKIVNAQLRNELGEPSIHDVITCDSKRTAGIQVADLLLGCVMAAWQQKAEAEPKRRVMAWVADHLGWGGDLRHDTFRSEWKFNIWHFYDPPKGQERKARTLAVALKYPMPAFRPASRQVAARPSARGRI